MRSKIINWTLFFLVEYLIVCYIFFNIALTDTIPSKSINDIEGTYLKIKGSEMININGYIDDHPVNLRKDTLTDNKQTKEIYSFKFFDFEKFHTPIKLYEVHNVKIKSLSDNNYYITDIKKTIKDNENIIIIGLSHFNSNVLTFLDAKADKEITISDKLYNLKKDTIITVSNDNKISINNDVKKHTINYNVKNKTYYKYDTSSHTLESPITNTLFILIPIFLILINFIFFNLID